MDDNSHDAQPVASSSTAAVAAPTPRSPSPSPLSPLRRRVTQIDQTDHLYLRLPSGAVKYVKPWAPEPKKKNKKKNATEGDDSVSLKSQLCSLGKFGTFDLRELVGKPFGWTWEIGPPVAASNKAYMRTASGKEDSPPAENGQKKNKQKSRPNKEGEGPGSLRPMLNSTLSELEETTATNEDIYDDPSLPAKVAATDIQALKASGLEGQELIDGIAKLSKSYEKRTVYSQDKYNKKKESKHLRMFTPLAPTLMTMCDYHFDRQPEKIRGIRADTLAQMMSFGGVAPGGRYLLVDATAGLLTAACLERMGGKGRLMVIHDTEGMPEMDILKTMNYPDKIVDDVLKVLNWSQIDEDFTHTYIPPVPDRVSDEIKNNGGAAGLKAWKVRERERSRLMKRWSAQRQLEKVRCDFFQGDFDGLLVASPYEPYTLTQTLLPYLAGSAPVGVHSPHLQPLVELHALLRQSPHLCNLSITEPWLRKYQVLPGRTHPEMMTSATAGYLFHAIRVLDEDEVQEIMQRDQEEALPTHKKHPGGPSRRGQEVLAPLSADEGEKTDTPEVPVVAGKGQVSADDEAPSVQKEVAVKEEEDSKEAEASTGVVKRQIEEVEPASDEVDAKRVKLEDA